MLQAKEKSEYISTRYIEFRSRKITGIKTLNNRKSSIHQQDKINLKGVPPVDIGSKYTKQEVVELKGDVDISTVTMRTSILFSQLLIQLADRNQQRITSHLVWEVIITLVKNTRHRHYKKKKTIDQHRSCAHGCRCKNLQNISK